VRGFDEFRVMPDCVVPRQKSLDANHPLNGSTVGLRGSIHHSHVGSKEMVTSIRLNCNRYNRRRDGTLRSTRSRKKSKQPVDCSDFDGMLGRDGAAKQYRTLRAPYL
jgi:hypothetical protein